MIESATTDVDPVLLPYLTTQDDDQAERELAHLLNELVEPLAKDIVTYKLRAYSDRSLAEEAADVIGDTVVRLLAHLYQLKHEHRTPDIRNLRSYVAVTAYRSCSAHLRRKYPRRHSLKNKLRYFLDTHPDFAAWADESGEIIAGRRRWQQQIVTVDYKRRRTQLFEELPKFQNEVLPAGSAQELDLPELLNAIFDWTNAPLELDMLVSVVAVCWHVSDVQAAGSLTNEEMLGQLIDSRSSRATELADQSYLGALWNEIKKLSPKHCAALLLNLRDGQNESALDLFLITNTASVSDIATAVGKTERWLAEVWNRLPLPDALIAEELCLGRQQVINLRRTARLRLARLMEAETK